MVVCPCFRTRYCIKSCKILNENKVQCQTSTWWGSTYLKMKTYNSSSLVTLASLSAQSGPCNHAGSWCRSSELELLEWNDEWCSMPGDELDIWPWKCKFHRVKAITVNQFMFTAINFFLCFIHVRQFLVHIFSEGLTSVSLWILITRFSQSPQNKLNL